MADRFTLQGSYTVAPSGEVESLDPEVAASIDEEAALQSKESLSLHLTSDSAVAVPFGTVTAAHVLIVKVLNGCKVKVRVSSADGATQSIPVNGVLILMSAVVPITAVDLTRVASTDTMVRVFLGEAAS